jgi:serine protease inhibitor
MSKISVRDTLKDLKVFSSPSVEECLRVFRIGGSSKVKKFLKTKVGIQEHPSIWPSEGCQVVTVLAVWCDLNDNFVRNARENKIIVCGDPTLDQVNQHIENGTGGHFKNVIDDINGVIAMIVNTIYFKSSWASKFDKSMTRPSNFQGTAVMMMNGKKKVAKHRNGIALETQNDCHVVLTMDFNVNPFKILKARKDDIMISLPKFQVKQEGEITEILQKNFGTLFSSNPMEGSIYGPHRITKVIHGAMLKVDEDGAEATSHTAVIMKRGLSRHERIVFNRPFKAYIIFKKQILFEATVGLTDLEIVSENIRKKSSTLSDHVILNGEDNTGCPDTSKTRSHVSKKLKTIHNHTLEDNY